jgi:hypothetical protein
LDKYDVIVIGSGAGGAITASKMVSKGLNTLMIEEGEDAYVGNSERFTLDGMSKYYRDGGHLATLSSPAIAWAEGKCLGGGTELNSGIYHRPSDTLLSQWSADYGLSWLKANSFNSKFTEVEQILKIKKEGIEKSHVSKLMSKAADSLGWEWVLPPRWITWEGDTLVRHTMRNTYVDAAVKKGLKVLTGTKVIRILHKNSQAVGVEIKTKNEEVVNLYSDNIVLSAGTVASAKILKASGFSKNIGKRIKYHPMLKLGLYFPEHIFTDIDLSPVQVKEFSPKITIGAAATSPGIYGATFARTSLQPLELLNRFKNTTILHASLSLEGSARLLPGGFLKYHFTKNDRLTLAKALAKSQELSFRMGASEVLIAGKDAVPSKAILNGWNTKNLDITAVHVTSSLPMGNLSSNPVDTLGAFKELENLFVIDGSILPDAPGVNPQGTIMAMASYLSENIARSIA